MPLRFVILSTLCFSFGILVASSVSLSVGVIAAFMCFILALFVASFFNAKFSLTFLLSSLVLLACLIGVIRFQSYETPFPKIFQRHFGNTVTHIGTVCDDVTQTESSETFTLCEEIFDEPILVRTSDAHGVRYGDTVTVTGIATQPENFYTEYGREFDYKSYLRVRGIRYLLLKSEIDSFTRDTHFSLFRILFAIKNSFARAVGRVVPSPESDLVNGVLLGMRSSFSESLRSDMISTGTIHIVALSGYNVSIVANIIMSALGAIASRLVATLGGAIGIIFFVLMTGAASSAVRAGVMAVVLLFAKLFGRPADTLRVICYTVIGMLLWNPLLLPYDVSFHLSFLALLGILYLLPVVSQYLTWIRWAWLRELIGGTLSAQIAVTPYVFHVMGIFSLLSLPVNVIILPFVPILMLLGCFTGIASLVLPILGQFFTIPTYWTAHGILGVIMYGASYDSFVVSVSWFPLWVTILLYIPIGVMMSRGYQQLQKEEK